MTVAAMIGFAVAPMAIEYGWRISGSGGSGLETALLPRAPNSHL
jgi:hypothetical protein